MLNVLTHLSGPRKRLACFVVAGASVVRLCVLCASARVDGSRFPTGEVVARRGAESAETVLPRSDFTMKNMKSTKSGSLAEGNCERRETLPGGAKEVLLSDEVRFRAPGSIARVS